jgi:hypothetical protein
MLPVLVLNPADDAAFASSARAAVDAYPGGPLALQDALRRRYPSAVVHPRELTGEPRVVWYVYRDGHWVGPQRASYPAR